MGEEKERENSNSILPGFRSPISSSANLWFVAAPARAELCGEFFSLTPSGPLSPAFEVAGE